MTQQIRPDLEIIYEELVDNQQIFISSYMSEI